MKNLLIVGMEDAKIDVIFKIIIKILIIKFSSYLCHIYNKKHWFCFRKIKRFIQSISKRKKSRKRFALSDLL